VVFRHYVSRLKGFAFKEKVGHTSVSSHITVGEKGKEKSKETKEKIDNEMEGTKTKKHTEDVK
jgi:hypothetical protein